MTSGSPLLFGHAETVARRGETLIARGSFLAEIEALAERLPDAPYVVNFCTDRVRFAIAWAAAMLRAQITLLPGSRDAGAVTALRTDYPSLYVFTDDDADIFPAPVFMYPSLAAIGNAKTVPGFPSDQVAAVLFTSGSTGRPTPSPRRWGRLVASSRAAGAALGLQHHTGAPLVATVPHAHSYGLESAVMLPLQHGLLLTAERPFFPADVAAALRGGRQPGLLVTTPVHMRALVGDAATAEPGPGFGAPVRAGFVLSATAPLSADLASRTETAFNAPVFEIYGCSEAGQLATRRTIEGPVWQCLQGFHLRQDEAGTWAGGPDEPDVLLADEIELTSSGDFILQGRARDMVNVAGKRSSLAHLTRQLTAIDGVEDGVFLMQEADASGAPVRLAAIVVAPGIDAATILVALRERIDPAFLPRPLRVVDALPRNALGKLPRAEVLRLLQAQQDTGPLLLHFPADHPSAAGHFPANPIIPGAVLLDMLVAAVFPRGSCDGIESAKFHHPVRPGDSVVVAHRIDGPMTRFECRLTSSDQLVVSGALRSPSPSP
jgi:acyl-CoA synthetase (AMP-forming)/AMP-acid ligase II